MASVYSAGDFRNGTTFEMEGNGLHKYKRKNE